MKETRGLTSLAVADLCECSPAYLCDLIKGNRKVTMQIIDNLSKNLNLNEDEREELLAAYTYDRFSFPPEVMKYIIDNDLIDTFNTIMKLDKDGKSLKELANKLKNNITKR